MRRALIFSAEANEKEVGNQHFESALQELLFSGGELTKNLLGFKQD